ncbi:MAG TPA: hypothetical protein PLP94_08695, partial [Candidatus Saccharicenans sp.]|nr:hypothetical protein [Candidatus Saccharicenans sp.]
MRAVVDIFPEKFSPAMTRQAISAAAEIIWRSLFFIYFSFLFFIFLFSYLLSFFELVYPAIILKFSIGSLFPDC